MGFVCPSHTFSVQRCSVPHGAKMPAFESRFAVLAPIEAVRAFHQSDISRVFGALSPPGTPVTFQAPLQVMSEGAILKFTMWLGGCIPVRWTARHSEVSPHGFVDTMVEGPVKSWVHTHRFHALGQDKTIVEDSI